MPIPREGHVRDGEWSGHWAVGMEPGGGDSCYSLPMFGEEVTVLSFTSKFSPASRDGDAKLIPSPASLTLDSQS